MKVFADGRWHVATKHSAIMVEVSEQDKWALARMAPDATCYAEFHDADPRTEPERLTWMQAMKRLISRKDNAV